MALNTNAHTKVDTDTDMDTATDTNIVIDTTIGVAIDVLYRSHAYMKLA